ncbi:MAG: type II secretion system F family protein [Firmicutes bacterium]|nr:type II secretion system F family protein [Bacillota bacterium]
MLLVIAILISLTVSAFLFFLLASGEETDPVVSRRMEKYILRPEAAAAEPAQEKPKRAPLTQLVKQLAGYLEKRGFGKTIDERLERADIPLKGSEFLLLSVGAAGLGGWFFWILQREELILIGAALGYLLPRLVVSRRIKRRQQLLASQIADTITLISNSLKAGYSFIQAMDMVSKEMPPPISTEFARAVKEISLGADLDATLTAMAKRSGSDDLDLVLTVVQIQRQVGGNLSEILDTIAHTIRERIKIKGEISTLTAQGRISGLIISLLPVGLGAFLYIVNPEYISLLFTTTTGLYMVGVGVVSQLIGIILIRKIVNIEV